MPRDANRVTETSTTTGTGSLVLAGAVGGHNTFLSAFGSGSTLVYYDVILDGSTENEQGLGTYISGSNILQRDLVLSSSTGGKINFPAGTKIVSVTRLAETTMALRPRRASDIGLELIPASGQSAPMIRVEREGGGDAFTVSETGGMRSGRIDAVASEPTIQLSDTDQTLPAGRWRLRSSGGGLSVQRATSGNFTTAQTAMSFNNVGVGSFPLAVTHAAATITGGSINGVPIGQTTPAAGQFSEVKINDGSDITTIARTRLIVGATDGVYMFWINGAEAARVVVGGTGSGGATAIVTREKGDARYAPISSSRRWKRDILDADLIDLSVVPVRSYVMEKDGHPMNGRRTIGFVAEEVAEVAPEAVIYDEAGGASGLDPLAMIAAVTADFRAQIAALEARITDLEATNSPAE